MVKDFKLQINNRVLMTWPTQKQDNSFLRLTFWFLIVKFISKVFFHKFSIIPLVSIRTLLFGQTNFQEFNKGLCRPKHDTSAACQQVHIKRNSWNCILLETVIGWTHCILDICLVLLFQVLNMPSRYVQFQNLNPF